MRRRLGLLTLLGLGALSLFAIACWAKGEIDDLDEVLSTLWQDDPHLVETLRRL